MGTLTPKIIGIRILNSFKFKKEKDAKKEVLGLLKHKDPEPDVNVKNEVKNWQKDRGQRQNITSAIRVLSGWQPLHYAANCGFVDLVELLCDKGADVNGRDLNSQTPLHKAASRGHLEVVVALVARDAIVNTLDWLGQSPLELAVKGRNVFIMEILFRLGADYKIHDYSWAEKENPDKIEQAMKELYKHQIAKYPGYKNKSISKSLRYIDCRNEKSDIELTEMNLTLKTPPLKQPFYLYCSKVPSEYSHLKRYLNDEQKLFSDLFECMYRQETSFKKKQEFIFVIKLNAQPAINEEVVFLSPHGKVGKIIDLYMNKNQENDDETEEQGVNNEKQNIEDGDIDETFEKVTRVTVAVEMEQKQMVSFALALKEKEPEKFAITKDAVKIQPEAEPDAEIDIPEGAFDDPGELCLKVTEARSVNEERDDGNLLSTNVLDMSMSNKQQPKEGKGIDLSLPILSTGENTTDEEMCVITTSEEYPENEDDWEVIPAKKVKGRHGTALSFTATHFSIFVGASLDKIKKNKEDVTSGAQRSIYGKKKIIVFTLLKLQSKLDASFSVIVECATRKKSKKHIKAWVKKDKYELKQESEEIEVSDNQIFKVKFDGNVLFSGGKDEFTLAYESKRKENYQKYDFTVKDRNEDGYSRVNISAEVEIEDEEDTVPEPIVIKSGFFCTEVVEVPKVTIMKEPKLEYQDVASLDMKFEIPKLPKSIPSNPLPAAPTDLEQMDAKDEAMLSVLKFVTLRKLSTLLTLKDAERIAESLRIDSEILQDILYNGNIHDDFIKVFQLFELWRGKRPSAYKVDALVQALMDCGKEELATKIRSAADTETYPEF